MRKKRSILLVFLLSIMSIVLFSACSESWAFNDRWNIQLPNSCFSEMQICRVEIGPDIISVKKCTNVSASMISTYTLSPVDEDAELVFSRIKKILLEDYEWEQDAGKTTIEHIEIIGDIESTWDNLSYFYVEKFTTNYCLLLFDSSANLLYLCESY